MKFTTKLITLSLITSLHSCGKKEQQDTPEAKAKKAALEKQASKTHESVSEEFVNSLGEMSDTLTSIKDLDSAKSALPKLTQIGFKIKRIQTDREKLGELSPELKARLEKQYGSKMKDTMTRIGQSMNDLKKTNPDAYSMLEKVMRTVMQ